MAAEGQKSCMSQLFRVKEGTFQLTVFHRIENLMSNFASKLRRRSSADNLVSARGVTNYVRAVLVPELATLLVMDDMKIDAEKARKVLQDSVELGNFLNEEEDETIKDPEIDAVA